jgi:hypothetical protein
VSTEQADLGIVRDGDAPDQERAHAQVDYGFADVLAVLIIAEQTIPPGRPAEGSLRQSAVLQNLKAFLSWQLAHDLNDEVMAGSSAHQLAAISAAGE